jgi:multiple sugar transport system permease protein
MASPSITGTAPNRRRQIWLFLIPAGLLNLIWGWYPLLTAFGLSLTDAAVRGDVEFAGLDGYVRVANDPLVAQSFRVTIVFALLSIVLTFVLPIFVAILLMEMKKKVMRWMMLLWFLPLSPIAGALLWRYLYNSQYGLLQWIATGLGFPPQPFLNSSDQVLLWLVLPSLVLYGPGLIYLATLQSIPASYYEAAEIEGAGFWRKIWTISLPRMRPVILMMLTFAIIGNLQQFEWPALMTGGGPGGASRMVVMYVYSLLQNLRYADATALSVYLFALIMAVVIVTRMIFREDPDAPRRRTPRELLDRIRGRERKEDG